MRGSIHFTFDRVVEVIFYVTKRTINNFNSNFININFRLLTSHTKKKKTVFEMYIKPRYFKFKNWFYK